jgi:hypothetical protein
LAVLEPQLEIKDITKMLKKMAPNGPVVGFLGGFQAPKSNIDKKSLLTVIFP